MNEKTGSKLFHKTNISYLKHTIPICPILYKSWSKRHIPYILPTSDVYHSFNLAKDNQYVLQSELPATKRQKVELIDQAETRNVDDSVVAWRYEGESLEKEKIAIDDFVDRKLVGYDDLSWLSADYGVLLNKYSRLLSDEKESRMAVERLMINVKIL